MKIDKAIPYGTQDITQQDIDAVIAVLHSKFLTQGPLVKEFEEKFAAYVGSSYAVAVTNGTAALHLSAMALGVNADSKVITTPITFSASANCIRYCGGEVVFADIDPETALLDINNVRAILEEHPKGTFSGIIPVDFAGYPVDMAAFRALADEHGLWILEDSCHAPGAYFTDKNNTKHFCGDGSLADLAIFSFHPVKHIATGEGGMITTNSEAQYKKLLKYRSHGMVYQGNSDLIENHGGWYMEMQELGYNYRLSDINAALGVSQLSRAQLGLQRRHEIAKRYDTAFAGTAIKTIPVKENVYHGLHLYIIQVENRKGLYDYLRANNIFAQVHYVPVHLMPYYQSLGSKKGDMPVAEKYYDHCLSIPMYPTLTDDEQVYVIEKILNFYN
ncbi:pyridoxal-phosphate-dependent aminotransferase [Cytophaga hutchinsonii ATCC 33406]|uniref:Pyridoxal-phosphate-dependent aminotransferase n=1 Tax=Cytophaga hutchinsonii (strain ATCC 33406 / DSM 1761 / CIP 103989 / NBRC 15051 / NCIMB 9469 / D465) TaxID=269798 RepID=A0A6N4SUE9_CYTH3|nr:pyridoxal-phosphate-dependent aminotransferase [Cytophaga hutchinsonii ATCC 33406]SFX25644.1 UDP-4-amino-4,6-dideoxy-N-acetyl-beta-L-altrosamine transaminase [Cytophaga hutchinsonii ATCC 33406]